MQIASSVKQSSTQVVNDTMKIFEANLAEKIIKQTTSLLVGQEQLKRRIQVCMNTVFEICTKNEPQFLLLDIGHRKIIGPLNSDSSKFKTRMIHLTLKYRMDAS